MEGSHSTASIAPKYIYIAYDRAHQEEVRTQAERGAQILCLDFWLARELKKNGINCVSPREYVDAETGAQEWWLLAQEVARQWYRIPAMRFFEHDNIRIAEALEPILETYLSRLFYFARIYAALKQACPESSFSIADPFVSDAATAGSLVSFERWAVVDAAHLVGLPGISPRVRVVSPRGHLFPRSSWKSLVVRAYNALLAFVPRRSFKIFASDYWSQIGPLIRRMEDTELVLVEASELKHLSWREILRYRVRIRHPEDGLNYSMKRKALTQGEAFKTHWNQEAREQVARYLSGVRADLDWGPVLDACGYLVAYSPRVIADIDSLRQILKRERPDVIVQLASVGGRRHHFFLIARIAAQLGIPSIELQHAGAGIDPRWVYSRLETDLLAAYGEYTRESYAHNGYNPARIIPVGSPRFDRCINERPRALEKGRGLFKQLGLDPARVTLLIAVPFASPHLFTIDTYQLGAFFENVREMQKKIPRLQVLFKFRNYAQVGAASEYLKELFPSDMAMAGNEDIFALLCASDAAVCSNSTVLYETMLAQKPLLLYPWKTFDTYHAQVYEPAAPLAYSPTEAIAAVSRIFADASYRAELLERQKRFLSGYSFDGKSVERAVAILRSAPALRRARERVQ